MSDEGKKGKSDCCPWVRWSHLWWSTPPLRTCQGSGIITPNLDNTGWNCLGPPEDFLQQQKWFFFSITISAVLPGLRVVESLDVQEALVSKADSKL